MVRRRVENHGLTTPTPDVSIPPKHPKDGLVVIWTNATTFSKIIGVIVLILAIASLIQANYFRGVNEEAERCRADFIDDTTTLLRHHIEANEQNVKILDELVLDVLESQDRNTTREALQTYRAQRQEIIEFREANPITSELADECNF